MVHPPYDTKMCWPARSPTNTTSSRMAAITAALPFIVDKEDRSARAIRLAITDSSLSDDVQHPTTSNEHPDTSTCRSPTPDAGWPCCNRTEPTTTNRPITGTDASTPWRLWLPRRVNHHTTAHRSVVPLLHVSGVILCSARSAEDLRRRQAHPTPWPEQATACPPMHAGMPRTARSNDDTLVMPPLG